MPYFEEERYHYSSTLVGGGHCFAVVPSISRGNGVSPPTVLTLLYLRGDGVSPPTLLTLLYL